MESRLKRIEALVILAVLIGIAGIVIQFRLSPSKNSSTEEKPAKELPAGLSKDELNKITYQIKTGYNESDYDSLYQVFGEFAKAQITPDQIKTEFDKLLKTVGKIETYAYSHYVYEGFQDGADWFRVYYKARFTNGGGSIKILFRSVDDKYEVTGIRIQLEEL